ncbi:MAG: ZIP family metal transporter [Patescibacteria group bacterium]|nr:ZIP family metal transporter [Patescibacteria group bacterium]
MPTALLYGLISTLVISIIGQVGFFVFILKDNILKKILIFFVSFSAGSLIGGAFFHLLPDVIEKNDDILMVFVWTIVGFCLFFMMEKFLRWHHCHDKECEEKKHLGQINMVGDGIHNFLDGVIVMAAFVVSPALGLATSISIISHEIPQELGDFGVLLYSGYNRTKAIIFNFLLSVIAVLGALVGYFLSNEISGFANVIIPIAAGGFFYIAASDFIPEMQKEINAKSSIINFLVFVLALAFMFVVKLLGL